MSQGTAVAVSAHGYAKAVADHLVRLLRLPSRRWLAVSALVVIATTVVQMMRCAWTVPGAGLDYRILVWGPTRGLVAGFNPYGAPATEYMASFAVEGPSGPHPPSLILLQGATAALPSSQGFLVSVALACAAVWAAILLTVDARQASIAALTLLLGSLVVLGGPTSIMLQLGQVTWWAALGAALVLRFPQHWAGSLGLSLVLIVPSIGVPLTVFLLAMRMYRLVWQGWLIMLVLSLPAGLAAVHAAGGLGPFASSFLRVLEFVAGPSNAILRLDIGGRLTETPLVAGAFSAAVIAIVAALLWRRRPHLDGLLMFGLLCAIGSTVYHMPYHVVAALAIGIGVVLSVHVMAVVKAPVWAMLTLSTINNDLVELPMTDDFALRFSLVTLFGIAVLLPLAAAASIWQAVARSDHVAGHGHVGTTSTAAGGPGVRVPEGS